MSFGLVATTNDTIELSEQFPSVEVTTTKYSTIDSGARLIEPVTNVAESLDTKVVSGIDGSI